MPSRSNKQVRYAPSPKPKPALGMQPMDRMDASGNRLGARRVVGPADEATRRAALQAALQPGPPVASAPKTPPSESLTSQGGGMGNYARRKVIDQTVDKMSR